MSGAIRLTGTLGTDARACSDSAGVAWLYLELHSAQHHNVAAMAVRCYGPGPAANIAAHSKARELRKNTLVTVHADRWYIAQSKGALHLALADVTHIDHQPNVRSRGERTGANA